VDEEQFKSEEEQYKIYLFRERDILAFQPGHYPQEDLRPISVKHIKDVCEVNNYKISTNHLAVTLLDCFMQNTIIARNAINQHLIAACCIRIAGITSETIDTYGKLSYVM